MTIRSTRVLQKVFFASSQREKLRSQLPLLGVAAHAVFQFSAVLVDQLAGQNHQPGQMALIPGVQQLGQLGRERGSGSVRQAAVGVKLNARLRGVGDHKAQRRLPGQRQIGAKVPVRIDGAGNAANLAQNRRTG